MIGLREVFRQPSPDPIEFKAGDFNFYRYVLGDCVNFRDPSGLDSKFIYLAKLKIKENFLNKTAYIRDMYPDAFYIYAHGDSYNIYNIKGTAFYGKNLKELIDKNGYTSGQDVVLFSYNTGSTISNSENLAQSFSKQLKAKVYAPVEYLAIPPSYVPWNAYTSNGLGLPNFNGFKEF